MRLRTLFPLLLSITAFGCGANQKLLGPSGPGGATRAASASAAGASVPGAVYTMTNAVAGNAVVVYARSSDGSLGAMQTVPTGGAGTGASLGNQGALALGEGGRWLFVVNAGSNDVSVFRVTADGLALASRAPAGGTMPVSVTAHHDLVYVLDAGGAGNIQGFRLSPDGVLAPIAGSNRPLTSASAGAAQIGFDPSGTALVVSEKATNRLGVYTIGADGSAAGPVATTSSGPTPYGFGWDQTGTLVVSEAFGGGAGASAVSSYEVGRNGAITLASGSVPTNQTAACWIAVEGDGRFAYTANAGSGSVTGYAVASDGTLARLPGAATTTPAHPSDMAFSDGSQYLYVLSAGSQAISAYTVDASGTLTAVGAPAATPAGVNGIAAR